MKIHEHQAKALLRNYGVPTPRGEVAFSVDEAVSGATKLGGSIWVVKAQIHAGGRGKGGGVKLARSIDEVRSHATEMLGMQLVTHQTGPAGQEVRRILVEEGVDIARELYLGMVIDRETGQAVAMASTEGGVEIEKVAVQTIPAINLEEYTQTHSAPGMVARLLLELDRPDVSEETAKLIRQAGHELKRVERRTEFAHLERLEVTETMAREQLRMQSMALLTQLVNQNI